MKCRRDVIEVGWGRYNDNISRWKGQLSPAGSGCASMCLAFGHSFGETHVSPSAPHLKMSVYHGKNDKKSNPVIISSFSIPRLRASNITLKAETRGRNPVSRSTLPLLLPTDPLCHWFSSPISVSNRSIQFLCRFLRLNADDFTARQSVLLTILETESKNLIDFVSLLIIIMNPACTCN